MIRRVIEALEAGLLLGLALAQAGCQSDGRSWIPPDEHKVTIASEALFLRTQRGDYVDGYIASFESGFQRQRMFMTLELTPYLKGDRLVVTGRFAGDTVRVSFEGRPWEEVRVFKVERGKPSVPLEPVIPSIK